MVVDARWDRWILVFVLVQFITSNEWVCSPAGSCCPVSEFWKGDLKNAVDGADEAPQKQPGRRDSRRKIHFLNDELCCQTCCWRVISRNPQGSCYIEGEGSRSAERLKSFCLQTTKTKPSLVPSCWDARNNLRASWQRILCISSQCHSSIKPSLETFMYSSDMPLNSAGLIDL